MQNRLDELVDLCRKRGMNVTPQRLIIYRALLDAKDHPSPDTLYKRVKKELPSVSLATIYKALDALSALGVVREVSAIGDTKRYDANLEQHHHLICTQCKSIRDFYDEELDAVSPPRRLDGFVARSVSVEVLGLCERCATTGDDKGARRTELEKDDVHMDGSRGAAGRSRKR